MPLLQLPSEILHQIIDHAHPEGFEPLMLTCKQIHNSGKSFLNEYNILRRHLSTLAVHSAETSSDVGTYMITKNLVEIVHSFARRPELGWFVKNLDIRFDHAPSAQAEETLTWLREDRKKFGTAPATPTPTQELIENNPWIKAAGFDVEAWTNGAPELWPLVDNPNNLTPEWEDLKETSWLFLFVLLLTRLPRLQTLHGDNSLLTRTSESSEYPVVLLELMSSRIGNDGAFYNQEHVRSMMQPDHRGMIRRSVGAVSPLEHLEEVRLCYDVNYESRANPAQLDPFLTSPRVRKLCATNLVAVFDGYTGIPYTWPSTAEDASSLLGNRPWGGIEHLELLGCCVDAQGLGNIVSHLPFLKTFRLAFQTKWHGCQHDWSVGEVTQALAMCEVPDSLDRDDDASLRGNHEFGKRRLALQITDLAINIIDHFGSIITGVSDQLHEFKALRRLSVDLGIFLGPTVVSGERMGESYIYEKPTAEGATPWKCEESHVPKLVDLIPASVEELELVFRGELHENWAVLLRNFAEEKDEKMPNLKKLTLRGEALIEKARELGLGDYVEDGDPSVAQWQVDFANHEGWAS